MPSCQHTAEYVPGQTELGWCCDAFKALLGQLVLDFSEEERLLAGWDVGENKEAAVSDCRQQNGLVLDDGSTYMRAIGIVMIASTMKSHL